MMIEIQNQLCLGMVLLHLGDSLKNADSNSVGLSGHLRVCISNKLPSDACGAAWKIGLSCLAILYLLYIMARHADCEIYLIPTHFSINEVGINLDYPWIYSTEIT